MAVIPIVREKQNITVPKPLKTPEPKPSLESINLKAVDDNKLVEEPKTGVIDQNNSPMIEIPTGSIDLPKEKPDSVFVIVEKMPEPVGGWQTFFKTLGKNIKYPKQATRSTVGGRVFVGFTVNEKGQPQDFSIVKGIGFGCDEEAARVIALTKWNPGKQRGRPVKVRLVQPVMFRPGTP